MKARLAALGARARAAVRAALAASVRRELRPRREALAEAEAEREGLRGVLPRVEAAAAVAREQLDRGPVGPQTTVHAAHRRDPRVAALFARRGLPACLDCAVGADETLAEAAFGEGFAAHELVEEINRLLGHAPPPG